jgi:2-hydroxy-6-oxonona-2,4-dienedioate hydrolase
MRMLNRVLVGLGAAAVVAGVPAVSWYRRDMVSAHARVRSHSQLLASPFGDIEFAHGGSGPHVLVVHGSGGGFDQGELMVQAILSDRVHWIAPSRFGYLRSTFHAGATFDEQAHAYAYLLDHLGIDRAAVVALSHGGPSALLLAALHPHRVTALALISAGVASSSDASQQQANRQGDALTWIFQRDYRYWAITTAFRRPFFRIMGVSNDVIAQLTPDQRRLADEVVERMNPVSLRAAGVRFDNQAAMPNARIATIRAPTLIVHAKDDTLQQYRHAEFAAATIPGARLVGFERGGHLLMAIEPSTLRALVETHILEHARADMPRAGTGVAHDGAKPASRADEQVVRP